MKASTLISYLECEICEESLLAEISAEVEELRSKTQLKSISAPIYVVPDTSKFEITSRHVRRICEGYRAGTLNEASIVYITTALQMHELFVSESERIEDALSILADPGEEGFNDSQIFEDIETLLSS